jgi:quinoprotein glucose dehydrogenase
MIRRIAPVGLLALLSLTGPGPGGPADWPVHGGTPLNIRYSPLRDIDTNNVHLLQPAWVYRTGDADTARHSQIQCQPIVVDGVLYATSATLKLFALQAGSGKPLWTFDPATAPGGGRKAFSGTNNSRGVTYWSDGRGDRRILFGAGHYLHCVDARTGLPVLAFGDSGRVDLHDGLGPAARDLLVNLTTPGIVYRDLIIIGSRVDEAASAAPGHVRAYDVRTGRRRWTFHTIPRPGEPGYRTWDDTSAYRRIGGANSWSGLSLDPVRGIVFVPTGSASFDFYGGRRKGDNLYANCLLALDAATGRRIWHFQTVHHDVWDRDLPTAPALVTVTHAGRRIDAVAQPTKSGFVFLFERTTGRPLFPIEERPVPVDTELKGERLAPTQPFPLRPAPFARQSFPAEELNDLVSDSSRAEIRRRWEGYRKDHLFAPPARRGTIILPGFDGAAEWGGPAFDPATGMLYVNANEMPWVLRMVDQPVQPKVETFGQAGRRLYTLHCMACHGPDRKGSGNNPDITQTAMRYDTASLPALLRAGRRMMPSFAHLTDAERQAVTAYLLGDASKSDRVFGRQPVDSFLQLPYGMDGYNKFLTREGYPAIRPPWGTLNAIDLNKGEIAWKVPLGTFPEFEAKGIVTGSENYGGPVVTAGGLVFIAATRDGRIRAFDKRTGRQLWSWQLPAPGFATPATYAVDGRQYLVIACGGGKLGTKSGDSYMAFSLPQQGQGPAGR